MTSSRAIRPRRYTRLVAALTLAAVLPLAPALTPGARADDAVETSSAQVAAAEATVAEMQRKVDETAAVLEEGTRRLEEGQAELTRLQTELAAVQREAEVAVQESEAAKDKLGIVVAAAYRSPVPDKMQLALTTGPDGLRDALVARADLDRVRGSSQDVLREATAKRVKADELVRTADQLAQAAAERERALAAEVEKLRATALDSERQLQGALDALNAARAARQAALDEAARRAADAAAAAAAAEAARRFAASNTQWSAACTGAPIAGQANGQLSPASLCPLDDAPGHALRADAAAAFNAMNAASKAERGVPICVTDSYRSYSEQVAVYASKPNLAAVPGRSNHGWGQALDLCGGVERFGSEAHLWMRANAGRFGWFHPDWAQAGGSKPEPWHWEFAG